MKQAVLIMVDTQRQDMLSCYDADAAPTPVLDALAREGMQFTNGYTCQPVCGPGAVRDFYRALPAFQRDDSKLDATRRKHQNGWGMAQPAWD